MPTISITEPISIKANQLIKLNMDSKLNNLMIKTIQENKSMYEKVGNLAAIKSLKI